MSQRPRHQSPAGYEIRVDGHLGEHWSAWFGGLALTHESDGTTTLRGAVDQAGLHGLLGKLRDLGVTLISVEAIDAPDRTGRGGDGK
ncbi:MAG: hypothetical protein GEU68_15020 [Actinobacteria bacterium]|nr:hypothetical protein [Actinomycetota bacterium]